VRSGRILTAYQIERAAYVRVFSCQSHGALKGLTHTEDMSPIANALMAAALVMGVGGAVVATSVADQNEPPRVGDPVIIQRQSDVTTTSQTGGQTSRPAEPTGSPATKQTGRPADPGNPPDSDPDDQADGDDGTIDDDDVEEVFPSPTTLDDDDADDGGGDDGNDRDEREDGADDDPGGD
jgi:hypothetical protein